MHKFISPETLFQLCGYYRNKLSITNDAFIIMSIKLPTTSGFQGNYVLQLHLHNQSDISNVLDLGASVPLETRTNMAVRYIEVM